MVKSWRSLRIETDVFNRYEMFRARNGFTHTQAVAHLLRSQCTSQHLEQMSKEMAGIKGEFKRWIDLLTEDMPKDGEDARPTAD